MSWTDEEIDQLYKSSADNVSFEYKNEYWKEMEAMLPEKKSKDFLWFLTSFLFLGFVASGVFMSEGELNKENTSLAEEMNGTPLFAMADLEENGMFGFGTEQKLGPKSARKGINAKSWERYNHIHPLELDVNFPIAGIGSVSVPKGCGEPAPIFNLKLVGAGGNDEMTRAGQFGTDENEKEEGIDRLPLHDVELASAMNRINGPNFKGIRTPIGIGFYAEVNGGLSQSLVTPTSGVTSNFGGGLGMTLQKGNFHVNIGGNVQIATYDDIWLNNEVKRYVGPTSHLFRYEKQYKQINTVEGVISLGYSAGRHNFMIGIRPSVVVWSKIDAEVYKDGHFLEAVTMNGQLESLNRFGLKPTLGYAFAITPKWKVGVNLGMRLTPAFKQEFITKENSSFPMDGQLYLRRSLLWK